MVAGVSKSLGKGFKVMQQKNFSSMDLADKKQCAAHNTSEIWIKTAKDIGSGDEHCNALFCKRSSSLLTEFELCFTRFPAYVKNK